MSERIWYKRKRHWFLIILVIWLISSRLGVSNFLYEPYVLETDIFSQTSLATEFTTIPFGANQAAYIKVGKRTSIPLIVFVHGSPGSLTAAKKFLLDIKLGNQADMISIDRLGFGYSQYGAAESSLQRQADMLYEILKPYLHRTIILVGHSMGGPVLCKYAMTYADDLDAMVLVAPSISPMLEPSNIWRRLLNIPPITWLTPPAFRVCNQEIIPLKQELLDMEDFWNKIKIPVTIIHGTEDKLVPYGNAEYGQSVLTNSSKVKVRKLEGGNHFIFWNEHDDIVNEILDLLIHLE